MSTTTTTTEEPAAAEGEKWQQHSWLRRRKQVTSDTADRSPRHAVAQVTAARQATQVRPLLLGRHEVVAMAGVTYPTIWLWMREGKFPRSRVVGGKSMWVSAEIDAWIDALPVRPLKPLDDAAQAARGRP